MDQTGLKLTDLPDSASQVLELKVFTTMPSSRYLANVLFKANIYKKNSIFQQFLQTLSLPSFSLLSLSSMPFSRTCSLFFYTFQLFVSLWFILYFFLFTFTSFVVVAVASSQAHSPYKAGCLGSVILELPPLD